MNTPNTLEQQLLEYKAILDNAGVAVIFTQDRLVYRCNPMAEELFGWPTGTLINQPGSIFFTDIDTYQKLSRRARPTLALGQAFDLELQMARRDGSHFTAHLVARAIDPTVPRAGTVWIIRDITQAVDARDSNTRLLREQQLIFERVHTGIVFIRDRIIQRCNPRFGEILSNSAQDLIGQSIRIYFRSEDEWQKIGKQIYADLADTGVFNGELPFRKHDGSPLWGHITGSMLDPENPDAGSVWLFEDVTARREAEELLSKKNRDYALIFDNAMIGISYMRDRTFLHCNRRLEEIFGFQAGGLRGKSSRLLFTSDEAWESTGHRVYNAANKGQGFSGEICYQKQDGTPVWVLANGQPIQEGEEQIWIWTHQDNSTQHLAEEALRLSHAELETRVAERTTALSQQLLFMRQLIETIPGPIFYKDAQARYLGCNSAFSSFVGIPTEDLIGKSVHDIAPDDLADCYLAADQALFKHPGTQIHENPVRNAMGELRDVMFHKATFTHPDGSVGGLVGFMLDITERKRMEARLQQSATVFDSSAEGITITAPDGSITAVNRAFTKITGYHEDEVIGQNSRMLQSGRQDKNFYHAMWAAIKKKGHWQGEIWNKRKNGETFPEWLTISAVKDKAGTLTHYVGVFSDITAIKVAHDQLQHLAHHDALTGLPNRLLLEDRLHVALQDARREKTGLAILFIDLDRFKTINDSLGHHVGDRVLREVSERMNRLIRESDTVARLGGDEFLILIKGIADATAASNVAEKILENLRETPVSIEQEFFVGASIGISLFPQDGEDSATLIKHADVAMYRAKERGRNTYEFFTQDLTYSTLERFQMETALRRAIERDELCVYLQPQFSLKTGKLIGAEALVRWQHPTLGLLLPGKFILLAEESGLIVPVGEWVQHTACHHWAMWTKSGLNPGILSINVSSIEFRRGRIQETVRKTLAATHLSPTLLELEITESAIMSQAENSIAMLNDLLATGIRLAIDDFGTGYSSLAYLKRLPLNKLKVDQSFVRGLPHDAEDCAIARAVIALGHSLQLTIIAEGVETAEQCDFLTREGCDEMQGYLRGKPMPMDEFEQTFLST